MNPKPAVIAATCALFTVRAFAQYSFTEIVRAGSSTAFAEIPGSSEGYYVSLNNSGQVAFRAKKPSTIEGIYRGSGGALTTIVEVGGTNELALLAGYPAINDSGQVAFWAATPGLADFVINRSDGISTTQIVSRVAQGFSSLNDGPDINSAGLVAFRAGSPSGLYLGSGGPLIGLYTNGDSLVLDVASDPSINDVGQAVFVGRNATGVDGMYRGSGGALSTIASTASGSSFSGFPGGVGSINSNGVVAFDAYLSAGGKGIFISTGIGTPVTLADTSGPFDDFKGTPSISIYGLAFTASLDAGGTVGIFTGSSPATNKVIQVGDPLFGSTVTFIRNLGRNALNDSGEIAFVAGLANGDTVVARASPWSTVPPALIIRLTTTNTAVVSWPSPSWGWNLYQNTNLTTTNWVAPSESLGDDGTNKYIVVNAPVDSRFFRLQQ